MRFDFFFLFCYFVVTSYLQAILQFFCLFHRIQNQFYFKNTKVFLYLTDVRNALIYIVMVSLIVVN